MRHIFTVASSETKGQIIDADEMTPCESSKRYVQQQIGRKVDYIQLSSIDEESAHRFDGKINAVQEKYEHDFKQWAEKIKMSVAESIKDFEGTRGNQQYLPDIVDEIIKTCKLVPFWSAVMVPYLP